MAEAVDDRRREQLRREYVSRVNQVMDYIRENLDGDLSLARLAREACFSPFHFHRVFRAMVGETLSDFIRRVRVERAAALLLDHPDRSITTIALDCGFSGSAAFARAFRARFGASASEFRRKKRKARSKNWKDPGRTPCYTPGTRSERSIDMNVEVRDLPELNVAYVRSIGPYRRISQAFERLMRWAGPRGLLRFPETKMLGVYHDNPEITDAEKLRADACITVPGGTPVDGEVGTMKIPGGLFAVGRAEIAPDQFEAAWNELMQWLPESGYQPDDRLCYEVYLSSPDQHPQGKFIIDICEPVRLL